MARIRNNDIYWLYEYLDQMTTARSKYLERWGTLDVQYYEPEQIAMTAARRAVLDWGEKYASPAHFLLDEESRNAIGVMNPTRDKKDLVRREWEYMDEMKEQMKDALWEVIADYSLHFRRILLDINKNTAGDRWYRAQRRRRLDVRVENALERIKDYYMGMIQQYRAMPDDAVFHFDTSTIEEVPGVYLIVSPEGILYVGYSGNLRQRCTPSHNIVLMAHSKYPDLRLHFITLNGGLDLERQLIMVVNPEFNERGKLSE